MPQSGQSKDDTTALALVRPVFSPTQVIPVNREGVFERGGVLNCIP